MPSTFVIDKLCCQRQEIEIFSNLSFQLDDGGILLIEGANGSGKSSLLRLLAGLSTPVSGDIFWQSKSISSGKLTFRQQLHYLGHSNGLRLDLTSRENLLDVMPEKTKINPSHASILEQLNIDHKLSCLTRQLSAGQKRKLALAKLFISQKKLWLLDEPLTALDTAAQDYFTMQLQQHLQHGGIAVMSSHQTLRLTAINMQVMRLS